MRKQTFIFLLLLAVALPSFTSVVTAPRSTSRVAADVQLEKRVMTAVREKFGNVAAADMWVEAKDGNVILHGAFAEMMSLQIASRVRRVEGVKSARWGVF
jgi:osmotically-inducible protein OsmY